MCLTLLFRKQREITTLLYVINSCLICFKFKEKCTDESENFLLHTKMWLSLEIHEMVKLDTFQYLYAITHAVVLFDNLESYLLTMLRTVILSHVVNIFDFIDWYTTSLSFQKNALFEVHPISHRMVEQLHLQYFYINSHFLIIFDTISK